MGPIVLCYVNEDIKAVERAYDALRTAGFESCIDGASLIDRQDGAAALAQELQSGGVMLVFLSKNAVRKLAVPEHGFGQILDACDALPCGATSALVLRINDCEIPEQLGHAPTIDLFVDDGLVQLVQDLHESSARGRQAMSGDEESTVGQDADDTAPDDVFSKLRATVYDGRGEVVEAPTSLTEPRMPK